MKNHKLPKSVKKKLSKLIKNSDQMRKAVEQAKKDGDEYMFYLSTISMAKTERLKEGKTDDTDKMLMADSMILALLLRNGATYTELLRVAQTFDVVAGFLAAIDMLNAATE